MHMIEEAKDVNSIKGLKINYKKDKISTYKLYIIDKAQRQSFIHKYKYIDGTLDVVVFDLDFFYIDNFSSAK